MEYVVKGDLKAAFDKMKRYATISETEIESVYLQSKAHRDLFKEKFGVTVSYEFMGAKKVANSVLRLRYIEKGYKHPSVWILYFYRNEEGWALVTFDWSDKIRELFSE
jgi:hypothetical protein